MPAVPAELGFRMPAEFELHAITWIAWPHNRDDWPGKFEAIPWVFAEITRHLMAADGACILVNSAAKERQVRKLLGQLGLLPGDRLRFLRVPTNRVWTRDYGAVFVTNPAGEVGCLDWHFNAWAKYPDWQLDDAVPGQVAHELGWLLWQPTHRGRRVVLEGGSIDVNGTGLLLTTEECLLSGVQCRNPGFAKEDYERVFADYLGVAKVLWLGRGIVGDDTHGHVDDLARFVSQRTVVAVMEDDPQDENYIPLQENLERLRGMTDQEGGRLEVIELPMPDPVYFDGQRLPASYANFYIANDRVLVPTFNDPMDRVALGILADLFPGRIVAGIHAIDLVWGLGTLHCLTQQQPAGKPQSPAESGNN